MELIIGIIVLIIVLRLDKKKKSSTVEQEDKQNAEPEQEVKEYEYAKKCLMTPIEKKFFDAIRNSVNDNYTVHPQVNLATIVEKHGDFKYQNELYRNIDFGVFDSAYNVVLLIEINDETHNDPKRRKRDARVREICDMAQIPLVAFQTKYGVNQEYIAKRIREHIK